MRSCVPIGSTPRTWSCDCAPALSSVSGDTFPCPSEDALPSATVRRREVRRYTPYGTLVPKEAGEDMLLGLDPVLSPDLLHALAAMGHGDRIALVDANYPGTRGRRVIYLPGLGTPRVLEAVLSVFPIDTFIPDPCATMQVVG